MKFIPLLLSIIIISQASAQSTFNPGKSLDFIPLDDPDLEIKLIHAGAISGDAKFQLEFGLRLLKGTGRTRGQAVTPALLILNRGGKAGFGISAFQ
jgi:hypothetical protein